MKTRSLHYSWDPEGERVAFLVGTSEDADVFITDVGCSTVEPLTYDGGAMTLGNWSEDGDWVAYSILSEDGQGIFLRNPSGVDRKRISDKSATQLAYAPRGGGFAFMTQDDEDTRIWASENVDQPPVSVTNQAVLRLHICLVSRRQAPGLRLRQGRRPGDLCHESQRLRPEAADPK